MDTGISTTMRVSDGPDFRLLHSGPDRPFSAVRVGRSVDRLGPIVQTAHPAVCFFPYRLP